MIHEVEHEAIASMLLDSLQSHEPRASQSGIPVFCLSVGAIALHNIINKAVETYIKTKICLYIST